MQNQARWCTDHTRWECTHPRSKGRGTCHGSAVTGTAACRMHLGRNAQVVKQEQETRMAAEEACRRFGVSVETTASDALLRLLYDAAGDVAFYRARVAELSPEQMTAGTERVTRRTNGTVTEETITAKSRRNEMVALMMDAQRHYLEVAAVVERLGIDKQALALLEWQAGMVATLARRCLEEAGIRDEDVQSDIITVVMGEIAASEDGGG